MSEAGEALETQVAIRARRWSARLRVLASADPASTGFVVTGKLSRMIGMTLEARGCESVVGSRCLLADQEGHRGEAEVVGFADGALLMMPTDPLQGMMPGARVIPSNRVFEARVGPELLGRVLDGAGRPIDGLGALGCEHRIRLQPRAMNPLSRGLIREPLDVGVRSINALLTVGRGQRLGLFARSGLGKSMLLGMMTRHTRADVIVVALVGERGREVQEFISETLDAESRRRAVVVATPADHPPLMRVHSALLATSIAEYFRDKGKHVLLLMDSLTRVAQAQREIALAVGEPPVQRGYPVSVFARIPELVERAGNAGPGGGSITAFYTVLTEGDELSDPVADAARAVLDGHLRLSADLADAAIYPAIDIGRSVSRAALAITTPAEQALVARFRQLNAVYEQNRDLITVGAYSTGRDRELDQAIELREAMVGFLRQSPGEAVPLARSFADLAGVVGSEGRRQ